jgi:hypothetical protein
MPITIQEYTEKHVEAVRQFNQRLRAGGEESQFAPSPIPEWLPKLPGRDLFQEYYLAVDDAGIVRGGYILKHQDFLIKDRVVRIADFQLPISEGSVDRRYAPVGVQLVRDALRRQPLLFGLGMGGYNEPVARLLRAAHWSMFSIPFFFRVVHPVPFLKNLRYLQQRGPLHGALLALAWSGLGWVGIRALQAIHNRPLRRDPALAVEPVDEFSDWAYDLWHQCKHQYGMTAVRNAESLSLLYPASDARFIRLKVTHNSRPIGWAVVINSLLKHHKHFGAMRLGSIVSCFGSVENTPQVVREARRFLESQGVDLIVSNHSHAAWRRGFHKAGFWQGPSNFIFTASPQLTELLRRQEVRDEDIHVNRGDGDGPIHL